MACKKLRIEAIRSAAKFLCEFEDLPLRFDAKSNRYHVTGIGMARGPGDGEQERVDEINEVSAVVWLSTFAQTNNIDSEHFCSFRLNFQEDIEDDVIVESVEDYDSE